MAEYPDARIRATYALDLIDAVSEQLGFPPPVDPAECPHPPDEQWALRPGRQACGDCGRVISIQRAEHSLANPWLAMANVAIDGPDRISLPVVEGRRDPRAETGEGHLP